MRKVCAACTKKAGDASTDEKRTRIWAFNTPGAAYGQPAGAKQWTLRGDVPIGSLLRDCVLYSKLLLQSLSVWCGRADTSKCNTAEAGALVHQLVQQLGYDHNTAAGESVPGGGSDVCHANGRDCAAAAGAPDSVGSNGRSRDAGNVAASDSASAGAIARGADAAGIGVCAEVRHAAPTSGPRKANAKGKSWKKGKVSVGTRQQQADSIFFPGNACDTCKVPASQQPLHKCNRCSAMWYCSKECQIASWRQGHKHICRKPDDIVPGDFVKLADERGNVCGSEVVYVLLRLEDSSNSPARWAAMLWAEPDSAAVCARFHAGKPPTDAVVVIDASRIRRPLWVVRWGQLKHAASDYVMPEAIGSWVKYYQAHGIL